VSELLTDAEHRAMALSAELWNVLVRDVVGDTGTSRAADLRELGAHLHAIQQAVLSQAAGRAYPDRYRLLGRSLAEPSAVQELSVKAVYEKLNALPARDRADARWVASRDTMESLAALTGRPKPLRGVPMTLLGLPVDFDDTAVGLDLRPPSKPWGLVAGKRHTGVIAWRA
jgi:hypothetical protein